MYVVRIMWNKSNLPCSRCASYYTGRFAVAQCHPGPQVVWLYWAVGLMWEQGPRWTSVQISDLSHPIRSDGQWTPQTGRISSIINPIRRAAASVLQGCTWHHQHSAITIRVPIEWGHFQPAPPSLPPPPPLSHPPPPKAVNLGETLP